MIRALLAFTLAFIFPFTTQAGEKPFLPIQAVTTPAHIDYWLIEDHSLPILALSFGFKGAGSVNETPETQGLARLLSNTLDEGAGPYDSRAFQAELENNAIQLSFGASRDHFYGSLKTLTRTRDKAAELLRLALTHPRFTDEAVQRMIQVNLTRVRSSLSDPEWLAARLMNDRVFGDHPYRLNSGGTLSTLPKLTPDLLRAFKENQITRDRLRIGIVGDITREEASALVDQIFAALPVKIQDRVGIPLSPVPSPAQGKTFLYQKDIPQTIIMMSAPAPLRTDPDYAAFTVLNNIFGGSGFGSRLMEEIREKSGLTYGIYSGYDTLTYAGQMTIQASTRNETARMLLDKTDDELRRLAAGPVTDAELQSAKGYLLGAMPMALTSTESIAGLLLDQQLDGQPVDGIDRLRAQIRAVTRDDLARAAKTWTDPAKFVRVLVGNPKDAGGAERIETIPNIE